jgi:hypothetical protein
MADMGNAAPNMAWLCWSVPSGVLALAVERAAAGVRPEMVAR